MAESTKIEGLGEKTIRRRWTAGRKKEVVLRLLRGEAIDELSRELGVPIGQLENWKETVLKHMEYLFKEHQEEPVHEELEAAKKRIGELCMENELLREKSRKQGVFWGGKW